MTGLCDNGHEVYWPNTRGGRKPERCNLNDCRAVIHAARYNSETRQYERIQSGGRSGKLTACVLCGRKRRVPGGGKVLERAMSFRHYMPGKYTPEPKQVEAGSVVCWYHREDDEEAPC